ncbi:MAG: response regulator [Candidatus Omnitrophota bacterium]
MAEKILIVDDDRELREELHDFLEGYEIIEASNGEEALRILKKANEIRLVILDVKMPGVSGLEVLNRIKKTDPSVKIIILTGHSSKDTAIEALKGRADDYIEKPINIAEMKESVENFMEDGKNGDSPDAPDLKHKVERVMRFVERNWCKKVTLKEAAAAVYMSPKYLSRIFREYAGEGFSDYKLALKIKKSKDLLKSTGYNINQIAYKMGYENAESFIRQFKRLMGLTPSEYRRKKSYRGKKAYIMRF